MNANYEQLFKELDTIFKPIGIQPDAYNIIFKPYTTSVERFLKMAKLQMIGASWLHVFHKHMLHTKVLLTNQLYVPFHHMQQKKVNLSVCKQIYSIQGSNGVLH